MWLQLRDIEILVQAQLEQLEAEGKDDETLRAIQQILYSTEVRRPMYISRSDSKTSLCRTDSRCRRVAPQQTKRKRSK